MNILIVEDDTAIREGVAEFLKEGAWNFKKQRDTSGAVRHYAAKEKWDRSVKRTADIQWTSGDHADGGHGRGNAGADVWQSCWWLHM